MKMNKKIAAAVAACTLVACIPATVNASEFTTPVSLTAEALILDVVVPTQIPFFIDSVGEVLQPEDVMMVENNSIGQIQLSGINVGQKGTGSDWQLVEENMDFLATPVSSPYYKLSASIGGSRFSQFHYLTGDFEDVAVFHSNGVINGQDSINVEFMAEFAPQAHAMQDVAIAEVEFMIDWNYHY